MERGDREAATRDLLRAVRLYDDGIDFWSRLGSPRHPLVLGLRADRALALGALDRHDDAIAEADAVLSVDADHAVARHARAVGLAGAGLLREAAGEIEALLARDPTREREYAAAGIHERVAEHYNREGNRARSYAALHRSWRLLPDPVANRGVREALEAMQRDYERLVRPLEAALRADPADRESRALLAGAYAAYGDYDRAGPLFAPLLAVKESRTPEVLFLYALHFWQWRDTPEGYRKAAEIYEEILRADPENPPAVEQLAVCRARLTGR
jgi:tetratricopeptide (TPR) repeat protein